MMRKIKLLVKELELLIILTLFFIFILWLNFGLSRVKKMFILKLSLVEKLTFGIFFNCKKILKSILKQRKIIKTNSLMANIYIKTNSRNDDKLF